MDNCDVNFDADANEKQIKDMKEQGLHKIINDLFASEKFLLMCSFVNKDGELASCAFGHNVRLCDQIIFSKLIEEKLKNKLDDSIQIEMEKQFGGKNKKGSGQAV